MNNPFSNMSLNDFYRQWGPQIDAMSRKIGMKVNYDFYLKGRELADDAVGRAWEAMPQMLAEYDPSITPLLPYLGQRLNWLFLTEKRKNAKRGEREILPGDSLDGFIDNLESDIDREKAYSAERRADIKNALKRLQTAMPDSKYSACLAANVAKFTDESIQPHKVLKCSRQYENALKRKILDQIPQALADEIRAMLHHDDSATVYGAKIKSKSLPS